MRALLLATCLVLASCASSVADLTRRIPASQATYEPSPGDSLAGPMSELEQRLTAWGIQISDLPPNAGPVGISSSALRVIQLAPDLPVNGRFEVLAHEAGHLFQSPALQDRSVAEVFAELVSVGVCRFYGHDTRAIAARYLAIHKSGLPALPYLQGDIDEAVRILTGQVPFGGFVHPQ